MCGGSPKHDRLWISSQLQPEERLRGMDLYTPILVLGAIAAAFAVVSVVTAVAVGPMRFNRSKLAAYECGIEPLPPAADLAGSLSGDVGAGPGQQLSGARAANTQRMPIKYYLTAMLFIVFDIEIVFLYPWAVSFDSLGVFALVEMVLFMLTVFVAYAYVWRRGGLSWD